MKTTGRSRRLALVAVLVPALAVFAFFGMSKTGKVSAEDEFGIEVLGVRLTSAGFMLDFRYRVLDADKAAPLLDRTRKAYLVDSVTGREHQVPNPPKVGPLRQSLRTGKPETGRTYFAVFGNPGKQIHPGQEVRVVIGDFRSDPIVVR